MPKGKKIEFRADGVNPEKVIVTIAKANNYTPVKPMSRISIYGMEQNDVMAFIIGAISYSLARFGSLDAKNWKDTQKETKNG